MDLTSWLLLIWFVGAICSALLGTYLGAKYPEVSGEGIVIVGIFWPIALAGGIIALPFIGIALLGEASGRRLKAQKLAAYEREEAGRKALADKWAEENKDWYWHYNPYSRQNYTFKTPRP